MPLPRCETCGKAEYASEHAAKKGRHGLRAARKGHGRLHCYFSRACRCWHVGH